MPEIPSTPICPVTRAENSRITKKLFDIIGLEETAINALLKRGLTSPHNIIQALRQNRINDLEDDVHIIMGTAVL